MTGWFIRNPVAANLLMVLILIPGDDDDHCFDPDRGVPPHPARQRPDLPPNTATAPAAQVDELVTQKIEKALEGLEGVRSVTSYSDNGSSLIEVRRRGGQDLQKLLDKVRLKIDAITDLPAAVRRPVIETSGYDFPALYLNIHGDTDPATLQTLGKQLKQDLLTQPEISRLKIWGLHERELRIALEPEVLQRFNLTISDVTSLIRKSSLNFQAGTLRTVGGNIFLRADNRAKYASEFAAIPIIERADGTSILLGDIATVADTFQEGDYLFRFNGAPTAGMEVLVGQKENLLRISEVVHEVARAFEQKLPPDISVSIWGNSSEYIADRLKLLRSNGLQGLLLVILILSLFLNVRVAFWVAMGIPVSVLGAIAISGSKWVDYSLNDITTFGFIIALGILVDDAVVVGESVYEERRRNPDPVAGTEAGVSKVAVATVFGVLTTIAAFFPLLLIDNPNGKVLAGFSGVVILALAFSLVESKFILPAHLAQMRIGGAPRSLLPRLWTRLQDAAQGGLLWLRDALYAPLLAGALRHRYAVLVLFIAAGAFGLGMIGLGKIKTVFFPDVPGQIITVNLVLDARAPFRLTRENVEHIHAIGVELNEEIHNDKKLTDAPIRTFFVIVSSANTAQIYAELTPVSERPGVAILDVMRQWRQRTGALEGATELQFTGTDELAGGFQLSLQSRDAALLKRASVDVEAFLAGFDGVNNIRDSLASGQPQLRLRVRPEARSLGFDAATLASQIGYSFGGSEVQKVNRDGSEIRVLALNTDTARDTVDDLLQSHLRSRNGEWIPFRSVAEIDSGYVAATIHRKNGKLVNTVAASIDRSLVAPEEVSQAVFEQLVPQLAAKISERRDLAGR